MAKLYKCGCGRQFAPVGPPPHFPCPPCREEAITQRFQESLKRWELTEESVTKAFSAIDLEKAQGTWKVVVYYSLLEHTVCEGSLRDCELYMRNGWYIWTLPQKGYTHWTLVPTNIEDTHIKSPIFNAEDVNRLAPRDEDIEMGYRQSLALAAAALDYVFEEEAPDMEEWNQAAVTIRALISNLEGR